MNLVIKSTTFHKESTNRFILEIENEGNVIDPYCRVCSNRYPLDNSNMSRLGSVPEPSIKNRCSVQAVRFI
jgi:hypothetical protein